MRVAGRYVIGMHSAYYTDRLITHPLKTAVHFIRSNFIYHLMTILPFELIIFYLSDSVSCNYYGCFTVAIHLFIQPIIIFCCVSACEESENHNGKSHK